MERAEQMPRPAPRPVQQKETPKYPTMGESARRVFYGVGKAIDPSPRAWNERIIKGVNAIIPKLSPRARLWIAKNHASIESGARVAGIAISTAETYVAFMLLGRGIQKYQLSKYDKQVNRAVATNGYLIELKKRFDARYPNTTEAFFPLAAAVIGVAGMYQGKEAHVRNTDVKKSLKTRFEGAFVQVAVDRAILKREPIDINEMRNQARSSFDQLQKISHPTELRQLTHVMRQQRVVDAAQMAADRIRRDKNKKSNEARRAHHLRGNDLLVRIVSVMRTIVLGKYMYTDEIVVEQPTGHIQPTLGQLRSQQREFGKQVVNQGRHQPRRDHQGRWK